MWIAHWLYTVYVSLRVCVCGAKFCQFTHALSMLAICKRTPLDRTTKKYRLGYYERAKRNETKIEKLVVCHWIDCVCVFECVLHQSGSGTFHNNQMKIISSLPGACNKIGWFGAMCIGKKSALSRLHSDRFTLYTFPHLVRRDFVTNCKQNVDMCKCMCLNSNRAAPAAAASRDRTYMSESMSDMCGKCVLKPINFQHKTEFSIYSHRMKR